MDSAAQEALAAQIAQYPVCEYAFVKTEDLSFLEQVRHICKTDCPQYGKSWSCPPAVGTVQECKARCAAFHGGFLFTTVAEVNDIADMEETLSTESCAICDMCAYPDAPCRKE